METFEVTKLSSKGQIVLPQAIRKRLELIEGAQFMVLGERDMIILKRLELPAKEQVRKLMKESRAYAKRVGLKKSDLSKAIRDVRSSDQ